MTGNDFTDPGRKDDSKRSPLGDPSVPPNPSVRDSARKVASQTGTTDRSSTGFDAPGAPGTQDRSRSTVSQTSTTTGSKTLGTGGMIGVPGDGKGAAAPTPERGGKNEKAQDILDEVGSTSERRKVEARKEADRRAARARAEAHAPSHYEGYAPTQSSSANQSVGSRLERLTRDRPAAVLAGAALAGFLVARLLRTSRHNAHTRAWDHRRQA